MPRPQRETGVKMNFDAMTDTITNVAGLMIRLVVLVLLITRPRELGSERTNGDGPGPVRPVAGSKSLVPLQVQIERLKAALGEIQGRTAQLEQEIVPLQQRVQQLRQGASRQAGSPEPRSGKSSVASMQARTDQRVVIGVHSGQGASP